MMTGWAAIRRTGRIMGRLTGMIGLLWIIHCVLLSRVPIEI